MQDVIPDLWPDEIAKTDILTPLAILRIQANHLQVKTRGLIQAEVRTLTDKSKERDIYHFDLVAPALDGYTIRLFKADHKTLLVYPIEFQWPHFDNGDDVSASSPDEVYRILQRIFRSDETKSMVMSLIAQSNEKRAGAA